MIISIFLKVGMVKHNVVMLKTLLPQIKIFAGSLESANCWLIEVSQLIYSGCA